MAADDGADTDPAFVVVHVEAATGCLVDVSAQGTAHPDLFIAPSVRLTAAKEPVFDCGRLMLVQASTGRRVAAADTWQVLAELAQQLAWFDQDLLDPVYLADAGNEELLASVAELFRFWRADAAEPGLPSRITLAEVRGSSTPARCHAGRSRSSATTKSLRRRPPGSIVSA